MKIDATQLTHQNCLVKYQVNKGVLNMSNREFIDKQLRYTDPKTGKLYVYYSSIPDGTEFDREKGPKTERAYTIIGLQKMERRADDGKIVYSMAMQCDLQMSVTPKLIAMFLPSGMQDWNTKLNKFIINNLDRI